MSLNYKGDKCLACKLFSTPLFYALGGYFAFRNRELYRESQSVKHHLPEPGFHRFFKYFSIGVPVLFFAVGSHCLYDAFTIFREQ